MGATTAMDAIEIADFLEAHRTGVLALADDDEGYAVPVSFAYDPDEQSIYLRLGHAPESRKREYVDAAEYVSFVVYDHTDDGWKSVVARGTMEELSENTLDSSIIEAVKGLDIPSLAVFDRPASALEFTIARIEITDLTGVVEG